MMDPKKISENIAQELCGIRENKIDKLRHKISSGAYRIKSDKVAQALIDGRSTHSRK